MSDDRAFLLMQGISKSFPGVKALDQFDFDLRRGEVHSLCGENGAGKSTLVKILSGAHGPDAGRIVLDQHEVSGLNPKLAMELGIQTIYQEHNNFSHLSVTENLFIGREICKHGLVVDRKTMREEARKALEFLESDISPDTVVSRLSSGQRKIIEIAKGLLNEAKVMILDEPTASFSRSEISTLFAVLRRLRDRGVGIVYISHHLDEVFEIADRVTVMRDGRKVATHDAQGLSEDTIIRGMIGRDLSTFYKRDRRGDTVSSNVALEAKNLSGNGISNASLYVREGELLGIAGMVGSGRTELAELLFGAVEPEAGEVLLGGERVSFRSPKDAIRHKMCLITEDRQGTGLFLWHSVVSNAVIAQYTTASSSVTIPRVEAQKTRTYVDRLRIATPSVQQKVGYLSGGNQQKVILAKWFLTQGEIFIFDEPTRGIDVGAKEEIYKLMTDLLAEGKSIIMISSEMTELIAMSDRIHVMRKGRIVGELSHDEFSEESILKYSIGTEREVVGHECSG